MGRIIPLGAPERHFWLTRSMARSIDVSLSEAMAEGQLSPQGYAELVTRCRQCPHVEACQHWLGSADAVNADQVPDHCLNATILNRLRR